MVDYAGAAFSTQALALEQGLDAGQVTAGGSGETDPPVITDIDPTPGPLPEPVE